MGTRGQGYVSAGPRPRTPGRPRLDSSVTNGPDRGQGRQRRQVPSLHLRIRPLVFSTNTKSYFGLCMMPISATLIQSRCTPKDGPVFLSDFNSCSDGDQCARAGLATSHWKETGRLHARRAPGSTEAEPSQTLHLSAAFKSNQTRRSQALPHLHNHALSASVSSYLRHTHCESP